MTVQALIEELQAVIKEKSERATYQVEDRQQHTIGWVRRGSQKDDAAKIVAVLPEVDT